HFRVGDLKQFIGILSIERTQTDADACIHPKRLAVEVNRLLELGTDGDGNTFGIRAASKVCKQHYELVTADAGNQIAAAHATSHANGDFLQNRVTRRMAIDVVDLLKAVQVDVHNPQQTAVHDCRRDLGIQPLVEMRSIREPRKQVLLRAERQLFVKATPLQ